MDNHAKFVIAWCALIVGILVVGEHFDAWKGHKMSLGAVYPETGNDVYDAQRLVVRAISVRNGKNRPVVIVDISGSKVQLDCDTFLGNKGQIGCEAISTGDLVNVARVRNEIDYGKWYPESVETGEGQ